VWSADVFHTVNSNDIQFVATATNAGYFDNVGNTRRQGLDLSLGGKEGGFNWHLTYSFVDATFQSNFEVSAESNSTADANGNILVQPGDRIPLIPKNTGRLVLDYDLTPQWNIGGNVIAASGSYLHGDENNANQAGGTNAAGEYVSGSGWISGYTVVNLQSTYHITKQCRDLCAPHQCIRQAVRHRRILDQQLVQSERRISFRIRIIGPMRTPFIAGGAASDLGRDEGAMGVAGSSGCGGGRLRPCANRPQRQDRHRGQ
jgi:outer membrane receptor for Fe3+-dicitrate